jgi:hypothetical protein
MLAVVACASDEDDPRSSSGGEPVYLDPPTVSDEATVGPIVETQAPPLQMSPQVAFGDGVYLVVWEDLRAGDASVIYGARVSAQGEVLDPVGRVISYAQQSSMPRCAFDGQTFLVVWAATDRTVGARVAPDGTLLDAEPFAIGDPGTNWADVTSGGTESLVLAESDERMGLQRVASDGSLVGAATQLSSDGAIHTEARIASNHETALALWTQVNPQGSPAQHLQLVRTTLDGSVLEETTLPAGGGAWSHDVGSNGSDYLVTWGTYEGQLLARRYGADGVALDDEPLVLGSSSRPTVSAAPDAYLVATADSGIGPATPPVVVAVDAATGAVGAPVTLGSVPTDTIAVAFGESSHLAVYTDAPQFGGLWMERLGAGAAQLDAAPTRVAGAAANAQSSPALALTDDGVVLAWCDDRAEGPLVLAQRLAHDGAAVDAAPIEVATLPAGAACTAAVAHVAGGPSLVAWSNAAANGSVAARMLQDGQAVGSVIALADLGPNADASTRLSHPTVGVLGDGFVVSWVLKDDALIPGDEGGFRTLRARVALDGTFASYGEPVVGWGTRLGPLGNETLLVFTAAADASWPAPGQVRAQLAGATLGPLVDVSAADELAANPTIATSEAGALVVWEQRSLTDGPSRRIFGALIDPGMSVSPKFEISAPGHDASNPVAAFDGQRFVVVWRDAVDGAAADLLGARVTTDGVVVDAEPFAVSRSPLPELAPSLVSADGSLVAYARLDPELGSTRVQLRHIE